MYGYNIPVNMFAAGALERAAVLDERIWHAVEIGRKARLLAEDIRKGIDKFGIVDVANGTRIYAYEVSLRLLVKLECRS